MTDQFNYDVFLSHSSKDKDIVRPLAERLRADGLRVWPGVFDDEEERLCVAQREAGLEQSRVLVLCLSEHAFGDEWAQLEAETFRFRDPLNQSRRFILLGLDGIPPKESLAQFLCIRWLLESREPGYAKILEACRPPDPPSHTKLAQEYLQKTLTRGHKRRINTFDRRCCTKACGRGGSGKLQV